MANVIVFVLMFLVITNLRLTDLGLLNVRIYQLIVFVISLKIIFLRGNNASHNPKHVNTFYILLVFYLVWCLSTSLFAQSTLLAVKQIALLTIFIFTAVSITETLKKARATSGTIFLVLTITNIIIIVYAYLQLFYPYKFRDQDVLYLYARPYSFFTEANELGVYLVCYYVIYFSFYYFGKDRREKTISICMLLIGLPIFLFNFSRGSIIATLVSIVLMVAKYSKKKFGYLLMQVLATIIIVIAVMFIAFNYFTDNIIYGSLGYGDTDVTDIILSRTFSFAGSEDDTWQTRVNSFDRATQDIIQNPLMGIGFNNAVLQEMGGDLGAVFSEYGRLGATTSNVYFDILLETGIVGFLLFLFSIKKVYYISKHLLNNSKSSEYFPLAAGISFSILGILINSISYNGIMTTIYWSMIGILFYLYSIHNKLANKK